MGVEDALDEESALDVLVVTSDFQDASNIGDVHIRNHLRGRCNQSAARGDHESGSRSKGWPVEGRRSHDEREELQGKKMKRMKKMKKLKKESVDLVEKRKIFFHFRVSLFVFR